MRNCRDTILHVLGATIVGITLMAVSFAAPTPAGTMILGDVISVNVSQVYVATANPFVSIEVLPIYGIVAEPTINQIIATTKNQVFYFPHHIENKANTADAVSVTVNTPAGWTVALVRDDNRDQQHQPGEIVTQSTQITLAAQTSADIFVELTAIALTPVTAQVSIATNKAAVSYVGFNGEYYGGLVQVTNNDIVRPAGSIAFSLKSLLQGFYNPSTNIQVPTQVSVELRQDRAQIAPSYTVTLKANGVADPIQIFDVAPGAYYVYIKHYNHMGVVTSANIAFADGVVTTINISEPQSPDFVPIYFSPRSQNVKQTMRTERNGVLTVRGGDYNGDNTFNIVDWSAFDYEWKSTGFIADFDGNGMIDTRDYGIWLSNNQDYLPID